MSKIEKALGLNNEILSELLSQLYKSEILEIFDNHLDKELLVFTFKDIEKSLEKVDLHKLANLYKKYVSENSDVSIGSYFNKKLGKWQSIVIPDEYIKDFIEPRYDADTEPKAIIQTYKYFREDDENESQQEVQ